MRKLTITIFLLFLSSFLLAQSPKEISYQAVVRDGNTLLMDSFFDVRFSILQGGTLVFQEEQSLSTNKFGLFSTTIGSKHIDSLGSINWANGPYQLQVEIDRGSGFESLGTESLVSVPYSLYADRAGSIDNLSITDLVDVSASGVNPGQVLTWDGTNWVADDVADYQAGTGINISGDLIENTGDTDATDDITTMSTAGGDVSGLFSNLTVTALDNNALPSNSPSTGDVLKWSNGWIYAPDAGGISYVQGNGIQISGNVISNTGDTVASDDITTMSMAGGDVNGLFSNLTVKALDNNVLPSNSPSNGDVLKWSNGWIYAPDVGTSYNSGIGIQISGNTINNTGLLNGSTAGGDLSGTLPNPTVSALRGMNLANNLTSAQDGQVLKWNATAATWLASDDETTDNDNSTQNEVINSAILNGQTLQISEAGTIFNVDLSSLITGGNGTVIQDSDGDTKIQVEESTDEDLIRFDAGGTEMMVIQRFTTGQALFNVNPGTNSVFMGRGSGLNSDLDGYNTALGDSALWKIGLGGSIPEHGKNNTAVGSKALTNSSTGYNNVAIGSRALTVNKGGNNNTGVGAYVMQQNINGQANTAVGESAMTNNTTGSHNVSVGMSALSGNTTGSHNISIGRSSLSSNTTGSDNVVVGRSSMDENTSGSDNVAIGTRALFRNDHNSKIVAIGDSALYSNGQSASGTDQGSRNTAVGSHAMFSNNTGYRNTAVGYESLEQNSNGIQNTSVGAHAMHQNISGNRNTAVGFEALKNNTAGEYNTAVGDQALLSNLGSRNSAFGRYALQDNQIGSSNTGVGEAVLFNNISGSGNTAVGKSALSNNTSGNNNTALGYLAFNGINAAGYTNATAIGYDAEPTGSNQVKIGNSSITDICGAVNFSTASDGRFKRSIRENVSGLDFVLRLRPVTYQFDAALMAQIMGEEVDTKNLLTQESLTHKSQIRYTGFIAQEVEQAAKELGYDFSGVHVPTNPDQPYSLRYAEFVVPLVKAIQEQQAIIEAQETINQSQDQIIQQLQARLNQLEGMMQGRK